MIIYIVSLALVYAFYKIYQRVQFTIQIRTNYHDILSLPRHWLWGNLVNCGQRLDPSKLKGRHPDYVLEEIWDELGRPPAFLLDIAPASVPFLVVAEPHVAEQVVQPSPEYKYSAPKSETMSSADRIFGNKSLVNTEGEEWKNLRRRFNKGFAPAHVHSLSPFVVDKTRIFVKRLQALVESGEAQPMKILAQDLTTDIITQLTIMEDLHCQEMPEGQGAKSMFGMLTASRMLSTLLFAGGLGFHLKTILNPVRPVKNWFYEKVYNYHVRRILTKKLQPQNRPVSQDQKQERGSVSPSRDSDSGRSIVQLALTGMKPDRSLIESTVMQIKTFLFAGQDTTATTIQWCLYELSKATPEILRALQSEHDELFGANDPFSGLDILGKATASQSEKILNSQLPYTTAFIKEALRLHPPAASARWLPRAGTKVPFTSQPAPPVYINLYDNTFTNKTPSQDPVRIDGLRIYTTSFLIHRNPKTWGPTSYTFNPDRWLDKTQNTNTAPENIPVGSFRPFERGPRNCIGQDLAMNELKIVMVAVARAFQFTKIGFDGRDGREEVYSVYNLTSVPVDGMVMSVTRR